MNVAFQIWSKLGFLAHSLHPSTGCRGVEICGNGSGPHPALRLHGRLPRRHVGRLCWKTHRAQHGVRAPTGNGSSASTTTGVEVGVTRRTRPDAVSVLSASFAHKPLFTVSSEACRGFLDWVSVGRTWNHSSPKIFSIVEFVFFVVFFVVQCGFTAAHSGGICECVVVTVI